MLEMMDAVLEKVDRIGMHTPENPLRAAGRRLAAAIPVLPHSAAVLEQMLVMPAPPIGSILKLVRNDPGLAAHCLGAANQQWTAGGTVETLLEALVVITRSGLQNLLLSLPRADFESRGQLSYCWRAALVRAHAAEYLALAMVPVSPQVAYAAALLRDVPLAAGGAGQVVTTAQALACYWGLRGGVAEVLSSEALDPATSPLASVAAAADSLLMYLGIPGRRGAMFNLELSIAAMLPNSTRWRRMHLRDELLRKSEGWLAEAERHFPSAPAPRSAPPRTVFQVD